MSKKIYTLEIKFDSSTDEVDYVLEKCDVEGADDFNCSWDYLDLTKYFDKDTIKLFEEYVITLDELPEA